MEIGLLTTPFHDLGEALFVARANDVRALELARTDETSVDRVREAGCEVAALASYVLVSGVEPEQAADGYRRLTVSIRLAAQTNVPVVSTLAGFPVDDDRGRTIAEVLPLALGPAVELAGELGVRLAFENWYRTNLRGLDDWRLFFETFPAAHVGLVFDPSHLEWQGIDLRAALREFGPRIFLAHAKDVLYDAAGSWRYVLPGRGVIDWPEFVEQLGATGYDGVLAIEHEDDDLGPAEGIAFAVEHLR